MLRLHESHDLRLLSSTLELPPAASVSWTNDAFRNAVATASFSGPSDGLMIESLKGDPKRSAAYFQIDNLQQTYVSLFAPCAARLRDGADRREGDRTPAWKRHSIRRTAASDRDDREW